MSKKVVIDAGHGGKDSGAAANGLKEKDIALKISRLIVERLNNEYEGVTATLTRNDDTFLELKERTDKANALNADILISVHCNAGGGAGGFESSTYNGVSDPKTTALQNVLHTEIMAKVKQFGVTDRGQKRANLHMCRESKMAAVLTENLFIDVATDAAKLKQDSVIKALVDGHVNGVVKYLGLKDKSVAQSSTTLDIYVGNKKVGSGEVENGVTMVPLRLVAEALGAKVEYNAAAARVDITPKQ